jgi:hypothetical protein
MHRRVMNVDEVFLHLPVFFEGAGAVSEAAKEKAISGVSLAHGVEGLTV